MAKALFDNKKIAVLFGGQSAERSVSLNSGNAVLKALQTAGVNAVGVDVPTHDLAQALLEQKIEHCFIALHGGAGENGTVQALLNSLQIGFTGSDVLGCALAMDKQRTKLLWQGANISTAPFIMVDSDSSWQEVEKHLGEKVMIKPACEGSSIGMSVVESAEEFKQAVTTALEFDSNILAEKWLSGNEYTIALLGEKALPVVQTKTTHRFYDFQAKYESNDTQYLCPCDLDDGTTQKLQQQALAAFKILGCAGWGRIDVMADNDQFYFLEANTAPGMTEHSLVPMAAKEAGLSFEQLVLEVLQASMGEQSVS